MNRLLLLLLACGTLIFDAAKADPNPADQPRCIEQTKEIFQRLNVLFAKSQLPPLDFDPAHVTVTTKSDRYWKLNLWEVRTIPYVSIRYLPQSCAPVEFYRDTYKGAPLYDNPPKPTWTESQAIENAKQWVRAVLNYFPENVATPKIGFNDQRNVPKYYDGHWKIRWDRTDLQGHKFSADALTVELSEKWGLMSIGLTFSSTFEEVQGKTISQEDAIEASRSPADTLLHGDLARGYLSSGLSLGTPIANLWVVNPNHIFQSKSLKDVAEYDPKARLAWVVLYPLMHGTVPAPDQTVEVWIDAQTKEAIGGDFK